jgi:hypothetical protein
MDPLLLDKVSRHPGTGEEIRMKVKIKISIMIPDWLDRICAWPVLEYRKRKYGYPFRKITLNDGKYTIVDAGDYYILNSYDWYARKNQSGVYYAYRFNDSGEGPKIEAMHRVIMGSPKGKLIDHRNGVGLDNRRENLRQATRIENGCNKRKRKNTTSRYIGVTFRKQYRKWIAAIKHGSNRVWLGTFDNEIDAAKTYDAAAKKYHGEFARLNFPENRQNT